MWAIQSEDKILPETLATERIGAIYNWITKVWQLSSTTGLFTTDELEQLWERLREEECEVEVEIKTVSELEELRAELAIHTS